jgi:hypothetical protein
VLYGTYSNLIITTYAAIVGARDVGYIGFRDRWDGHAGFVSFDLVGVAPERFGWGELGTLKVLQSGFLDIAVACSISISNFALVILALWQSVASKCVGGRRVAAATAAIRTIPAA